MPASKLAPTERFSDRVDDYRRFRPAYSPEIVKTLRDVCGLTPSDLVVDVGCGTGLLARIFLEIGNSVIGVEPNANMRQAGTESLASFPNFTMIDGSAEMTTLPAQSASFVLAGQAFHWFDQEATRREFSRILQPSGWAVVIWHEREMEATPFLQAYESFLVMYSTDYTAVAHRKVANYGALERFFAPNRMSMAEHRTAQTLDFEGLRGRMMSSSYMPRQGVEADELLRALPELFDRFAIEGKVTLTYRTKIYFGHLS